MNTKTRIIKATQFAIVAAALNGCATVAEKTNMVSDKDIQAKVAGTLGYGIDDVTISNRRTVGTDTYVTVTSKDKREFACTINGGNVLTLGMTNPPSCNRKK